MAVDALHTTDQVANNIEALAAQGNVKMVEDALNHAQKGGRGELLGLARAFEIDSETMKGFQIPGVPGSQMPQARITLGDDYDFHAIEFRGTGGSVGCSVYNYMPLGQNNPAKTFRQWSCHK